MREFEKYAEAKEKGQSYSSFGIRAGAHPGVPEMKEALRSGSAAGSDLRVGGAPLEQRIAILFDWLASISSKATASPRRSG